MDTAKATVATSKGTETGPPESEDEEMEYKARVAQNGRFVELKETIGTRSEKGVWQLGQSRGGPAQETIKLHDNPILGPRHEGYRAAKPMETSEPTELLTYLTTAGMKSRAVQARREAGSSIRAEHTMLMEANMTTGATVEQKERKTKRLSEIDIPQLKQQVYDEFQDILQGTKEELPPLREINHEIKLIDPDKKYAYRLPTCPVAFRDQFHDKLERYVRAGWWKEQSVPQAAPLMCIAKKDGKLRTVIDARQRNDNTVKDVTPMPDQELIREDVARAKYKSKFDLADAYEQVRVEPGDVHKTAFATILGTYVSNVVQQGDCNAPATFQRLMTAIFRDLIGRGVHVYLDDGFMCTDTVQSHYEMIRVVFSRLRQNKLYLKWSKCDLFADAIECLGHVIDRNGIHPDVDKLQRIRDWRTPRNYHDIQRFVGLVNYVANFLPDVTTYTAPLQSMVQNGTPFFWRPIHERCFEMIKRICCKTPIVRPIDYKSQVPVWLVCDASKTGVGAMYGQGPTWDQCRPAGFMSKKLSPAQQHYAVHELETLAILEALQKWEDKLMGRRLHVITDHKALEFFKSQGQLSSRQRRWMEYMSRFDFDITYVKGEYNKVADCLSRYYESDTNLDVHSPTDFVQADRRIDPDGEDLPGDRANEVKAERHERSSAMRETSAKKQGKLRETRDARDAEAEAMNENGQPRTGKREEAAADGSQDQTLASALGKPVTGMTIEQLSYDPLDERALLATVKEGYDKDPLTRMVLAEPDKHSRYFDIDDEMVWTKNNSGTRVMCVPRDKPLLTELLTKAHEIMGHYGEQRTCEYLRRFFWWPGMSKTTREFCRTCEACHRAKTTNQRPTGKLHSLPIPVKPWDSIGMDFVGPFPESRGFDYLWVVLCRLTSMVHLVPVSTTITAVELSWKYLREIVRLHGLPSSIVSDRDAKFTSRWWQELHRILGAKLLMSTSFHPQTDGQSERAIRNVGQILRTVVRPDQRDWAEKIDMVEFAINSSISESTGYAPFELNGGYMPSIMREVRGDEHFARGVKSFANNALQGLADAHDAIIEARTFQTHAADKRRSDEPKIAAGDLVYLSTKNLNMPKDRARKLCPKYIGPYRVAEARPRSSDYKLELPLALQKRRIHPVFHVSLLRPYQQSRDSEFPNRAQPEPYDFGADAEQEWFVDEIIGHRWRGAKQVEYEVRWSLGDTTWEKHASCNELAALDRYLELQGVTDHTDLPRHRS